MKQNQKNAATGWKPGTECSFIGLAIASPSRIASATLRVHPLEHGVAGRFAGDVQRFQNRHAAGHQRAQRARGAGQDVLLDQIAEDRHLDDELIPADAAVLELADQLDDQPDRQPECRGIKYQ